MDSGTGMKIKLSVALANDLIIALAHRLHWFVLFRGRTVELKDVCSGVSRILYNAKEAITNLNTPRVKDPNVRAFFSFRHQTG